MTEQGAAPADSLTDFAGGDAEGGRVLRASLSALLELDLDPSLRSRIGAVLRGDLSMRELSADRGLQAIAAEGIERLRADLDDLSPADREELVLQSRARARETAADRD
jgi:hypothetical protein